MARASAAFSWLSAVIEITFWDTVGIRNMPVSSFNATVFWREARLFFMLRCSILSRAKPFFSCILRLSAGIA